MKNKTKLFLVLSILFVFRNGNAQESVNSSGGNVVGENGTVSFSIGQVVTGQYLDTDNIVSEGVQQPYIESISEIDNVRIDHIFSVYPNPTTDFIDICTNELPQGELNVYIYNMGGTLVFKRQINDLHTIIDISSLDPSVFILSLQDVDVQIKQFKIVKY